MNRRERRRQRKLQSQGVDSTVISSCQSLLEQGFQHYQTGQLDQAENLCRNVIQKEPDNPDGLNLLAAIINKKGNINEAIELMEKAISAAPKNPQFLDNLGQLYKNGGRIDEAIQTYHAALNADPDFADAHNNLGNVLTMTERLEEAVSHYRRAIEIDPNNARAHYNLGTTLSKQGNFPAAINSFQTVLGIAPDYTEPYNNLGNAFYALGRSEEAVDSYRKALTLQPDYAEAHNNLGNALLDLGRLDEAVASFLKALAINLDYPDAWRNLNFATKAIHFLEATGDRGDDLYKNELSDTARSTNGFQMLEYYLDGFKPHEADERFKKTIAALPAKTDEEIAERGINRKSADPPQFPNKLVALLNFGRSGTGLFHSLIDGHPEISTLPSIYLSGFFNAGAWCKITVDGWRGLPERFADEFAVLFDATSPKPITSRPGQNTPYVGREEGMTTVGEGRNESLSLDRNRFCSEALRLMEGLGKVDPGSFLRVVHAAFERVTESKIEKTIVFYHIHNPDDFAKLNFLRYAPDADLVMMVREPIQSCESWIRGPFRENDYGIIIFRIIAMLFAIDQVAFRTQKSVGVRLEDLKKRPKATMRSLCAWLGTRESPSLYQMTAQGKKWWGDPSSPDYDEHNAMAPFDDASTKRPVGTIFSQKDQFVLRTLFYPFSVRFGYREPDPVGFEKDLKEIQPLFDDMLDFEKVMAERSKIDSAQFKRSGSYLLLRASFVDRWNVLNEFKDYPHMLSPLEITKD